MTKGKGAGDGSPPLTPERISQIAFAAHEGKAEVEDVRRLLALFYHLASEEKPIPHRLIAFVAESFGRYLGEKHFGFQLVTDGDRPKKAGAIDLGWRRAKTLDFAFGLKRKRGRPEADEKTRIEMAQCVVNYRLAGMSHQDAVSNTAERFGFVESIVGDAFASHRTLGLAAARAERPNGFTEAERRLVSKINRPAPKKGAD